VPRALADLYGATAVGDQVVMRFGRGWRRQRLHDVVTGAGFTVERAGRTVVEGRRARTLPDTVGPGMRLLVCGLNPSLYAADAGVGFARPNNRFWPAAIAAGLVSRPRDTRHALDHHGVGMTDLAKRATRSAAELAPAEYAAGIGRVSRLVEWLRPGAICFVGLDGWRLAIDRKARPGPVDDGFAGVPAYLMPSTSGLNAHARLGDLVGHLRAAAAIART
jgi:double-stranded uracil-DNA glycosylase